MVVGDVSLAGKICVVTGGGSGINLAFVRLALSQAARCLICDLKLTAEAQTLVNASPTALAFMTCDVASWSDLDSIPSEVEKAFGGVADIWIAGAGVFEPKWSSFFHDTETDHYKTLQINAEHPIKLTRIAMRSALGANKPAVVLIVSSGAGISGAYGAALYCASKHAVVGFTKSMAQADKDESIKVVCICPGMVTTPLWTASDAQDVAKQFSYTDDVCITAHDVAEAMVEMVTQGAYPGGSLLRVSKKLLREPLDSGQSFVDDGSEAMKAFTDRCYEPIRDILRKERSTA